MCVSLKSVVRVRFFFSPCVLLSKAKRIVEKTQTLRKKRGGKRVSPGPFLQEMLFPPLSEFLLRVLLLLPHLLLSEEQLRKSEDSFGDLDQKKKKKIFFTFHVLTFNWWVSFHQRTTSSSSFLDFRFCRKILFPAEKEFEDKNFTLEQEVIVFFTKCQKNLNQISSEKSKIQKEEKNRELETTHMSKNLETFFSL